MVCDGGTWCYNKLAGLLLIIHAEHGKLCDVTFSPPRPLERDISYGQPLNASGRKLKKKAKNYDVIFLNQISDPDDPGLDPVIRTSSSILRLFPGETLSSRP